MPNYIVLRDPRLPHGLDGQWYDADDDAAMTAILDATAALGLPACRFEATGDFEFRSDGAVAEVFRPVMLVICSGCGMHAELPRVGERKGFVSITNIEGWSGPPIKCPACAMEDA